MITANTLAAVTDLARDYVTNGHLPCIALGISESGKRLLRIAFAADGNEAAALCDGQYALASISKALTGMVTARLFERGVIEYDRIIAEDIPEFGSSEARRRIRYADIFNHSTGLPSRFGDGCKDVGYDAQAMLRLLCTEELVDEPGTVSRYTTHSYQLIVETIRRKLGLSMQEAVQRELCEACGLQHTGFYPETPWAQPVVDHPVPAGDWPAFAMMEMAGGGMWSTLDDLLALGEAWLTPGRLVSAETFALTTATLPQLPLAGDDTQVSWRTRGFNRQPQARFPALPAAAFYHGGATGTMFYMDPEREWVFVLMTNRWGCGNDHCFDLLNRLYG